MDPVAVLYEGVAILEPMLGSAGFSFTTTGAGPSSGGPFARGRFTRGDRSLSVSVRHSLGDVVYQVAGNRDIPHEWYMRAKLGPAGGNAYPGYSNDPLDGFRHLVHDLEHHCAEFLYGTDDEWRAVACAAEAVSQRRGFRRSRKLSNVRCS
jgi:hypothetical protein